MALRRTLPSAALVSLLLAVAAPAATSSATTAATSSANITTAPASAIAVTAAGTSTSTTGFSFLDIAVGDGVVLKANLIAPTSPGPHPALVFISSWGLNDAEYLAQAKSLAGTGYVVLSYTTRGFWGSGGRIETAGPPDIADLSKVIDWLVANTAADPRRIGAGGVSYGAGVALIGAAHDARIRAVAAMSGWTDLVESLYAYETRHPQAVWLLDLAAQWFGKPSAEFNQIVDDYFANRNVPRLVAWGQVRSAKTYLARLNANRPAILLANAYGDSIFGPNQLVDFFGAYSGPKRLEFSPGDHAIPELTGLAGLPNDVWASARRWLDTYVRGVGPTPPAAEVVLRVRNGGATESYVDWPDVAGTTKRYGLGGAPWWEGTGPLAEGTPPTGWSETISAVGDTVAGAGVVLLSGGLEALTGEPASAWLPAVNRLTGAVWSSEPLGSGAQVRGIARLHLTVKPSASTGTVVAYLYDVYSNGTGKLITHTPFTWVGAARNAPYAIDVALPATAWNVPAGHRLALVVDTEDPLYMDTNSFGSSITMTGPSWLDVPLR
ncbi:MAG TPA: CocE/NonD family hydrolase [Micromonosporaceae bacterium]|nr:CocE/NonD family hydrolase [Micromonosporaceae bacterium]